MPSIQDRDRKEIEHGEVHADHSHPEQQLDQASGRHSRKDVNDTDRSGEVLGFDISSDQASKGKEDLVDGNDAAFDTKLERSEEPRLDDHGPALEHEAPIGRRGRSRRQASLLFVSLGVDPPDLQLPGGLGILVFGGVGRDA